LLLEANLNELDEEDCGLTALMWASAYGQYHTVEDLLKFGALADLSNNQGQSALHFAAKAGYPEVITTLANYGANINLPDGVSLLKVKYLKATTLFGCECYDKIQNHSVKKHASTYCILFFRGGTLRLFWHPPKTIL